MIPFDTERPRRVPTAEEINALPDVVQAYIHDLETRCPSLSEALQTLGSLREQRDALLVKVAELEREVGGLVDLVLPPMSPEGCVGRPRRVRRYRFRTVDTSSPRSRWIQDLLDANGGRQDTRRLEVTWPEGGTHGWSPATAAPQEALDMLGFRWFGRGSETCPLHSELSPHPIPTNTETST